MTFPSVKTPTELIKILLEMCFIQSMVRAHDEGAGITDEGMHMRKNDVCLLLTYGVPVMNEPVIFQQRVYGESVGADSTARLDDFFGKADDRRSINRLHGSHFREADIFLPLLCRREGDCDQHGRLLGASTSFFAFCRRSNPIH